MNRSLFEAAKQYVDKFGFHIIPTRNYNKIPYIAWTQFQKEKPEINQIKMWLEEFPKAMIATITGDITNTFVLDLDLGYEEDKLLEILPDSIITPTAITPSGGKHLYFQSPKDSTITVQAGILKGVDFRCNTGIITLPPSTNGNGKKYEWIEGLSMFDVPMAMMPASLFTFIKNYLSFYYRSATNATQQSITSVTKRNIYFSEGTRDQDLFHVANQLIKMRTEEGMVYQVLETLANSCNPPFPMNEAELKIKSAIDRARKKERNLTADVRDWISVTNGIFSVTFLAKAQQCVTKEDHAKLRTILSRLVKDEYIQRVGDKDGMFRRVETETQEINWEDCDDTVIDVQWPFELHKYYLCLPKNIIIVAGSPDAGKTAFCLNFAMMNMDKFQIKYFSSEMGALELKVRLKKFPFALKRWKQVRFIERSSNFTDVIDPDGINIVDYIEVPEEAWKIATPINEIFRKLNKGICIIALQKPLGRDVARGGESTLDRPRLYLSMGKGVIKILKCKNWANESLNPNGLSREYKIAGGHNFTCQSEWGIPLGGYDK